MLEAVGLPDRVTALLRDSPDYAAHSFCLHEPVALVDGDARLLVAGEADRVTCQVSSSDARVEITGEPSGWQRLGDPDAINATLNRLFREADLDVTGDMDYAMHHWPALFWVVDAVRTALVDGTGV